MKVIQIVRKFGPFGGMEEYVYKLSHDLVKQGVQVLVLCEEASNKAQTGIRTVEMGITGKPDWISHFRFSKKVRQWLVENPDKDRIVHSHERQSCHHLTTFHTTPFNFERRKTFLHKFSPRHILYEKLERRELFGERVSSIVPVSGNLAQMIAKKHPKASAVLHPSIYPGVDLKLSNSSKRNAIPDKGGIIGFIGKEWKRKGLTKAVEIWRALRKKRSNLRLRVAGVNGQDIDFMFEEDDGEYEILGLIESRKSFYESIDLLIHPAKKEAFGMVITEALSMGVPVLCSSECGACELMDSEHGSIISCAESISKWVSEADGLLCRKTTIPVFERSWEAVAREYISCYENISKGKN